MSLSEAPATLGLTAHLLLARYAALVRSFAVAHFISVSVCAEQICSVSVDPMPLSPL